MQEKYFNGHSDTRSVQENFDLLTSYIQDSADKHIPSKTNRSVSSLPWITPEIRRKIRRKNKTHAKAKKTGSSKLRSKFETLKREIKADVRKQHDLYVNNLVGDIKANPRDFCRYINSQKKDTQGIPPLKGKNGKGVVQSDLEKAGEFNGQFTDVFSKNEHTQVPLLGRSAPFMNDITVSKDGVIKLLKDVWLPVLCEPIPGAKCVCSSITFKSDFLSENIIRLAYVHTFCGVLQHQTQECTIGKNYCFWLIHCTKGNSKRTPFATFITSTISNNIRSNGKKAWQTARKSDSYPIFFFIKYHEQYHCRNEYGYLPI